jgi:hypothetical protein
MVKIGECPEEFRQLANMIIGNILFIGEFHTSNSPNWRMSSVISPIGEHDDRKYIIYWRISY